MDRTEAEALVRAKLNPRRYGHVMNVLEMAADLARRCGEDEEKAATAALLHDLCKDCEKPGNALAHAGEAADLMKAAYGIDDEDVLNAVRYHTTGRAHMSTLELIVFLADTLEASRTYEGVERLRALTYEDLRLGALETLRELIEHVKSTGAEPAKDSLDAIAWLEGETEHMPKEEGTKGAVSMSAVVTREREAVAVRPPGDAAAGIALARAIAEAAADKKGRDIVILDISGQSSFADCFVNVTAANTRMLATIRDEVDDVLAARGLAVRGAEGRPESGWVLVDCGDVIVNIFLAEQREKYQIEKIWGDAVRVDADGAGE